MATGESWWSRIRRGVARFAARRAARLEARAPAAAAWWLTLACRLAPGFDFVHRDLCAHHRRQNDRLAALAAAQAAARRFERSADAWILLAEAYIGAYRHKDALAAYESALAIEERADIAMTAGELSLREGDAISAGARFAQAYAAGAGPKALRANAEALETAGDVAAARQARSLWEKETGKTWEKREK